MEEKLDKIQKDLKEIKEGIRRNDNHNSFITNMYLACRQPIKEFLTYFEKRSNENLIPDKDIKKIDEIL